MSAPNKRKPLFGLEDVLDELRGFGANALKIVVALLFVVWAVYEGFKSF